MSVEVWGMLITGAVALIAGLILTRRRIQAASGAAKLLALAPVLEAVPLAAFAAEHFTAASDLAAIVPAWLPWHLFWAYFVGGCLLAAAVSFIARRYIRWSASLLALLFLIFVATMDLPGLLQEPHNRIVWTLTLRELAFAAGAMLLASSTWSAGSAMRTALLRTGRIILAVTLVFYAVEHFIFSHNVPGVPLEKITPAWIPAPSLIAYVTGIALLVAGPALLIPKTARAAALGAGGVLLLLTVLFYLSILVAQLLTPLAVEGLNYFFDTMLFAATVLLAGFPEENPAA